MAQIVCFLLLILLFICHFQVSLHFQMNCSSSMSRYCSLPIACLYFTLQQERVLYLTSSYLCGSIQHVLDHGAFPGDNSRCLLLHWGQHRFIEVIVLHPLGVALSDYDVPSGFLIRNIFILKKKEASVNWTMLCGWDFIFLLSFFKIIILLSICK